MNSENGALLERIYETALDPSRLDALVSAWVSQAGSSLARNGVSTEAIERHLHQAFDISDRLFESSTPDVAQPRLTLNFSGEIVACNSAARTAYAIELGDALANLPFDANTLARLQECIEPTSSSGGNSNLISGHRVGLDRAVVIAVESTATSVTLQTTDFIWPNQLRALLKDAFALTKAEVDVSKLLAEGFANADVAATRHKSIETVRAQIRSIYSKTGVHSVAELTRLILGLAAFSQEEFDRASESNTNDTKAPFPRPGDRRLLSLPDGRLLDFSVFGVAGGKTILFLHDERSGDAWTAEAVAKATEMGLQIIAPSRPCYGNTDDLPSDVPERRMQVARDMIYLLDYLGCAKVVVIARVMGAGTAMCLSSLAPERIGGIVALAPALPVADEDLDNMNPLTRIMIHSLFNNRTLARFVMQSWLRLTQRSGIRKSLETLYRDAPADLAVLDNPMYLAAIEQGARLVRQQGYRGFLGDVFDEPVALERCARLIQNPTHIVVGEFDENSRKQRADRLAALSNEVSVSVLPGAGEMFFYTDYDYLLELANEYFEYLTDNKSRKE